MQAQTKFVPCIFVLTPSESGAVVKAAKEDLTHIVWQVYHLSLSPSTLISDPSPAIRSGHLAPMREDLEEIRLADFSPNDDSKYNWTAPGAHHVLDYAHVYRKIVQEVGRGRATKIETKDSFLPYMAGLINQCPNLAAAKVASAVATNELEAGQETALSEYLNRPGSGFFTDEWIAWFCTAAWIEVDSVLLNAAIAPSSQPLEKFFRELGKSILLNSRCSKTYLVKFTIPKMLTVYGHMFRAVRFSQLLPQISTVSDQYMCMHL